jgi:hypothetical protein
MRKSRIKNGLMAGLIWIMGLGGGRKCSQTIYQRGLVANETNFIWATSLLE